MNLYDQLNSLEDIDRLIADGEREGYQLDYKLGQYWDPKSTPSQVAKHVSAFANASGGLIIFGVETNKTGDGTLPVRRVPIDAANIDRIIRAMNTQIARPIDRVRWKSLPKGGSPEVFLVDIPASPDAPHQHVPDRRYYRREGESCRRMTHDIVELYFGRRLGPVLVPSIDPPQFVSKGNRPHEGTYDAVLRLENAGAGAARDVLISFRQQVDPSVVLQDVRTGSRGHPSKQRDASGRPDWRVSEGALVVHPTDVVVGAFLRFVAVAHRGMQGVELARVRLFADRMAPSEWTIRLALWDMGTRIGLTLDAVSPESPDTTDASASD